MSKPRQLYLIPPVQTRHNTKVDVLLVEDDHAIAQSVIDGLADSAIHATHVTNGRDAIELAKNGQFECVLLDLGLPDIDGTEVCRAIRATSPIPIIVLSARSTELDRVLALEIGADDYLVKPFGMRELIARIRAIHRRLDSAVAPVEVPLTFGDLVIDGRKQQVSVAGEIIHLTPKEFEILSYLAADPGAVCRRSDIIRDIWDTNWVGGSKSLDAHIAAIRKKLGSPDWIQSVHGVGFRFGGVA